MTGATHHYEVVVVGGTLSAAITAALLAARGLRGALLTQGELGASDLGLVPDLVPIGPASALVHHVHAATGVDAALSAGVPARPSFQVVYPDRRLDFDPGVEHQSGELARCFGPDAADAWARFAGALRGLDAAAEAWLGAMAAYPPDGFFARRSAAAAARRHPEVAGTERSEALLAELPEPLRELALGVLPFVTRMAPPHGVAPSGAQLARGISRLLDGLKEVGGLRQAFARRAGAAGFAVIDDAAKRVESHGTGYTLALVEGRDQLNTEALVDASADLSGLDAFPVETRRRRLADTLEAARPSARLHPFVVDLDAAVLPPPLAERVLLLNGRRRSRDALPHDPPILLLRRPGPDAGRVRLVALQPVTEAERHTDAAARVEPVIRARLRRLVPFYDEGRPETPDPRRVILPLPQPLFDPELDPIGRIGGVPTETGLKQVFVAGPAVLPGLGPEGSYLAALQAADAVERALRKIKHPRPLARRLGPA